VNDLRKIRALAALCVLAVSLAVYLRTLAPTVGLVDSGELTDAAWSLGNAHPPGFPLYLLLAHVFTLLPLGSIAFQVNIASAVFGALACALMSLAAGEWLLTRLAVQTVRVKPPRPPEKKGRGKHATPASEPAAHPSAASSEDALNSWTLFLLSAFAGLVMAFSRTLWAYATVAEVYTLNTALLAGILWMVLAWRRSYFGKNPHAARWLYGAALIFGLALGVHHVTIGLCLAGIGLFVFLTTGSAFFQSRPFLICAVVASVAVIAIYAYLPLAAGHHAPMNWGNPDSFGRILDHVTGKQYRAYIDTPANASSGFLDNIGGDLGPAWLPLALLLSLTGLVVTARRDRAMFALLFLMIVADGAWCAIYPIVNDRDAYTLPALVALVLAATAGASWLISRLPQKWRPLAMLMLAVPLISCSAAWRYRDRSTFHIAENYALDTLGEMEPNALLITGDWELYSPLRYFLDVERRRSDVQVIHTGLLVRSWYLQSLETRYPELMKSVQPELNAYRPLVDKWEQSDPGAWRRDEASRVSLFNRLNALLVALITRHVELGPTYATAEFALSKDELIQPSLKKLQAELDILPHGLVLQYLRGHELRTLDVKPLHPAGIADVTLAYDSGDVVVSELLPTYRSAYLVRGRYLAITKKYVEAVREYEAALALDPGNFAIQQEFNVVKAQLP
jgi:hypothetical protein